jgi:hypothetical protein
MKIGNGLRHYCRNQHCRTKLKLPVENERAAFCCRGCFERFYRRRCIVCERDLGHDPLTGEVIRLGRKFCGRKCKSEHRRFPHVYSVFDAGPSSPPSECTTDSKSAHSTGLKTRLRVVRGSVEHQIGPDDVPVNILGGYRWPSAIRLGPVVKTILRCEACELSEPAQEEAEAA